MTTTTLIDNGILKQHLIDPEICIRCNTCEAICPVNAITHDDNNYVVRADVCNGCMACISPCPTGSIDNWRTMPLVRAYSIEEQLTWEELPPEISPDQWAADGVSASAADAAAVPNSVPEPHGRARHGGLPFGKIRSHRAAVVGCAPLHQPVPAQEPHHGHRGRQLQLHRGGL